MTEERRKEAIRQLKADLDRCRTATARALIQEEIDALEKLRP